MKRVLRLALLPILLLPLLTAATPEPLSAQDGPSAGALGPFVLHVARLWAEADASGLADLAPADGRMMLDVGGAPASVQGRHAAAALRRLFAERESIAIRPSRVTVAGGRPLRGFGELFWTSQRRGVSDPQTVKLFIGTVWEGDGWRVREIRILP